MINRLLIPAVACCFLFAAVAKSSASSDDQLTSALPAARAWLAQIDAGLYDESYEAGSSALHAKVPEDRWDAVLKTLLPPWGKVVSRMEIRHLYKPDGIEQEHLSGECMIITYDTSFKNLPQATEVVVLQWEDGKWRGAGYNARSKTVSPTEQSSPQTETTTTNTKTPPQ